jgi:Lanthionine synthetase C-like protein
VLWRPDEHEPLSTAPWDEGLAQAAIRAIVADAEQAALAGSWPGHPLDGVNEGERFWSIYLGSAGMIWALWRLGSASDGKASIALALEGYRASPDEGGDGHAPSLLMGEVGVLAVACVIGARAADRQRLEALVRANRRHPTWELMWGSPGSLLAARACGLPDAARDSAKLLWDQWDEPAGVWAQDLYGHTARYLGPVHGFAGNAHALRGYVEADVLSGRVAAVLERTAGRDGTLVNWPPLDQPIGAAAENIRVQWCHGAPGIVATLGDLLPHELAIGAGELVWRAGPLRKGPGLCHGTAGNGFAFLRLFELTGDGQWLERARRFAMHALGQVEQERARVGRGRYTLFTGDIGVALYLDACVNARAEFPILDGLRPPGQAPSGRGE